ncbi:MAG: hypothetical protein QX189_04225 [Methylococcales bacterium]
MLPSLGSYSKKRAIDIITSELDIVAKPMALIWAHKASDYDAVWESDISDYFIRIVRVANNISPKVGKVGKLKRKVLIEKLDDAFIMCAVYCAQMHKHKDYTALLKTSSSSHEAYVSADKRLLPELRLILGAVADKILTPEYESCEAIAELIATTTIKVRDGTV